MTSTFHELSLLISDYPFDIVTLSETWLKNNQLLLNDVSIPSYVATYRNRDVCKGGGWVPILRKVPSLRGELISRTWRLRDLHNSSYDTKAEFNSCFIIHSK